MGVLFLNDTATTEIYTLPLHDALPISVQGCDLDDIRRAGCEPDAGSRARHRLRLDRTSTRLNSSHSPISYAVFCLTATRTTFGCVLVTSPCCGLVRRCAACM